ncbi:MAG TPA: GDP-mannose 4,6-dehydratase [Polyangiaceae bacterium]|nr:MAG: dTDP-glucose 4,6-dehydratase [Deltaproteobacteria bacterium ADurb.Bin207]HNZ24238.1 GDP-mannose 4,6-dehydratase [Polyangiaceae bacterium]HOD22873.1 GDP-mannose 4,6-dehydratase [Polyangiaceae bacterium]HOE50466.1 GDP-mannose 4,6-dehydratase [Polyangiaceae bacterium]HOH02299.1 GDP-mannose 4,6-dehydratase [Polyangiaceae bacterium]
MRASDSITITPVANTLPFSRVPHPPATDYASPMRIAVTGGAGFIGSHLVERLLSDDHHVLCIDNFDPFYPAPVKLANLADVLHHPHFTLSSIDLCDANALSDSLAQFQPNTLFHLAATAGVRPSIERPMTYVRLNVDATQTILSASLRHGVKRLILAGSSSVYGKDQPTPFREEHASDIPQSPYAATKRAMELLAAAHAAVHPVTITVCRLFTVYGPRQRPDLAISRFVRAMLAHQPITVFGDGTFSRDFTYVQDTVEGFLAAMHAPSGFHVYNLGAGKPFSVNELVSTIERVMQTQAIIRHAEEQKGDVPTTFACTQRAEQQLGWSPRIDLEEGIRRFVAWMQSANPVYFQVGEPWSLGIPIDDS